MATRENLSGYSKQTRKIVRLAQRDLRKFFALLDLTQPTVVRDALLDFLPQLAATYGDIAAVAAAEWYENLRGKVAGLPPYETVLSSGVKREAIVETVRWAAGGLWGDDPVQVRRVLEGCVQAWVKYSGRDTVARNVEFDPAKPRYARVPRGAHTCAWCAMLASRGFVYRTKETAGFVEGTFHNDCDCEIVPSFEAKSAHITGYDPDTLYAQYKAARAQVDSEGGDINDQHLIVAKMRRLFPESFKKRTRSRLGESIKNAGEPKLIGNPENISERWFRQKKLKSDMSALELEDGRVEVLEAHEIDFLERFEALNHRVRWIPKDFVTYKPTNDFVWLSNNEYVTELKNVSAKYRSIKRRIQDAVLSAEKQNVVKDVFIIDIKKEALTVKLKNQLQNYNKRVHKGKIRKLFVMSDNGSVFTEIELRE